MKLKIVVLILCSLTLAFVVNLSIKRIEKKYSKKTELVDVLVSKNYINPRTTINKDNVEISKIPKEYAQPGCFYSFEEIYSLDGKQPQFITIVPILKGEQILSTKLVTIGQKTGISPVVPSDMRGFVLICDKKNISGIIYPGDRVDIIATFEQTENSESQIQAKTILQNILVLAVGKNVISRKLQEETSKDNLQTEGGYSDENEIPVVLSVTPDEAQILALLLNDGKLTLSLRGLNDNNIVKLQDVNIKKISTMRFSKSDEILNSIQKQYDEALRILKKYQKDGYK